MSKLYSVSVTETTYGFVEVEASSEEEALELAQQAYHDGNVNWSNSEETYKVDFEFENL